MSLLVGGGMVLVLVVAGWWPARVLCPDVGGGSRLGRLALSAALGAAIIGLVQVAISVAGWPLGSVVPIAIALVSIVGGALWRPRRVEGDGSSTPRSPLGWPLVAALAVVALVSTSASVGLPFRADGSKFWAPKARDLALWSAAEAPVLTDPERLGFHRNYPLLVPALLAPVFASSPDHASTGPKLLLHALTLTMLAAAIVLLSRRGAPGRGLALALVTMPFLTSVDVRESVGAGGFVDGAAALFLLLTVYGVDRLRRAPERRDVIFTVLVGAALVSTKLEGAVELAVVLIAWLLTGPRRGALAPVALGTAALATPTWIMQGFVAESPPISDLSLLVEPANLLARSVPVVTGLGGALLDASCFGLLPLALLWFAWRGRGNRDAYATWLVLGVLGVLTLIYFSTTMHVGRHLYTSVHRLVFHWLPAFALLVASESDGR